MGPIPLGAASNIDYPSTTMRVAVFNGVLLLTILYALYRGRAPERWTAAIFACAVASEPLVHLFTPLIYSKMDPGHFVIDVVAWLGFFTIAIRAERFWPLCLVALHTITLMSHIAKFMDVSIVPRAYFIMQIATAYPSVIALAVGTYQHQRRLKANGTDPSWRKS